VSIAAALVVAAALGAAAPSMPARPLMVGVASERLSPLTVGAYYYPWYDEAQWRLGHVERAALGEYSSRDDSVIAAHYGWARRYGVDVFICSWWGPLGYDDLTIREHLLPAPARGPTRIALLYESPFRLGLTENRIVFGAREREILLSDFDYLAETYFRHPAYYRVQGRPVVVLYVSRIFRGEYGEAIRDLRRHVRERHGLELYLVGDEVDWDIGPARGRIRLYDAITGYTMYSRTQPQSGFLALVEKRFRAFRRIAREERVAFVPGVLPGFNDRGVRPEEEHYVLSEPRLFERSLALAGRYVDPKLGLMTVTSWNEWHEDTQIEPSADRGFGLLEALDAFRRAFRTRR